MLTAMLLMISPLSRAHCEAVAPDETATLTDIFDAYVSAVRQATVDNLEPALAFRTAGNREQFAEHLQHGPQGLTHILEDLRFFAPIEYTVGNAAIDNENAALALDARFKIEMPEHPLQGQTITRTLWVDYVREAGEWKINDVLMPPEPENIGRSPDENNEPESAYDLKREKSFNGRIIKVVFEPDYTLLTVLLVFDEVEYLVYLPNRVTLEESGFPVEKLKVPRLIGIKGHPHITNEFKTLASSATLH